MKQKLLLKFILLFLLTSHISWGQIISQYIDTNSGTTPKGIEIWNNTAGTLDFSTNNLIIQKGINGGTPAGVFTLNSGTLAAGAVIVIGTSDMQATAEGNGATFYTSSIGFNGNDALVVKYGGTTTDVLGNPGSDPGSSWSGNGVSTADQNISLKSGITTGDTDGWTDPSTRFETTSTDNSLTGFGIAPGNTDPILSTSTATLTDLNYAVGNGPSTSQSFTLSGSNLNGTDVTVTAPTDYEVSKDNASFSGSVTYTTYDGSDQTVYIRLKSGLALGDYNSETVSITGGGDGDGASVTVSGSVIAVTGTFTKITSLTDLESGWYVITNEDDSVLMTNSRSTTSQYDDAASNASGGTISNPSAANIWYIKYNTNGSYTIYSEDGSKYVGWSSSTTLTEEDNITDDHQRWTVSYDTDHFVFTNVSDNSRLIRYNSGLSTPGFKAYTTSSTLTNSYIQLYKKQVNTVTWDGANSFTWTDAANWDGDVVPTSTDNVVIPDKTGTNNRYPLLASSVNVTVNKLTVNSGGNINIGGSLTVTGDVVNNADNTTTSRVLVQSGGGSLLVGGKISGSNVQYGRTVTNSNKWTLIAAPVSGVTANNMVSAGWLTGSGSNVSFASYNETDNTWSYSQTNPPTTTLAVGQGYSVKFSSTSVVFGFDGVMSSDDITVNLVKNGDGYNLVGNPFPSYTNATQFLTSNYTDGSGQLAEQTIWLWDTVNETYVTKNLASNFYIAPMQGFFVKAATASTIGFPKVNQVSHATAGSDTYLKSTTKSTTNSRPSINLTLTNNTKTIYTDIYYIEGSTTGFDNGYDSAVFGGVVSNFSVYTHLVTDDDGKNLAIQSLPDSNYENMVVPVGLKADAGMVTFKVATENIPNGYHVYLEDRATQTVTQLDKTDAAYSVTLTNAADGIGRFYLYTTAGKPLATESVDLEHVSLYKTNQNTLKIAGLQQGQASVSIFSILGKRVLNKWFTTSGASQIKLPQLSSGIYIVKLQTENGSLSKKLVIK